MIRTRRAALAQRAKRFSEKITLKQQLAAATTAAAAFSG
jgi:hypothetical protein